MSVDQPISFPGAAETDRPTASRILATLVEASPLAIVAFDPEGVVTMWNPAAERIFGWSENEALGTHLPFVPAEKQEEFLALRRRALLGEVFTEPELHRRRADGSPIVVSVSSSPLRLSDGTIYGIMSILMDVTEAKAAEETRNRLMMVEERLRQSQKMEAVGRLAGGVAHDFNNLLTAISGYSNLLLHRLPESSTLRRDVEEIRKAGDRAAALTRQLLAFSRRQVLRPTPGDGGQGEARPLLSHASPGTETVLLAEDEEVVRRLARELLTGNGYKVLEAANGREALLLSEGHRGEIHLLLTDVVMPKMGGRELAERIRLQRPGLGVLYMSGYTDDAILRRGVPEDGIPFLQKPFTPEAFARKVREVLDRA